MPSQFRVAGYPPEHIYQKLKDFAKEHNLSESKALIKVLAEYFGVASNVAQEVSYKYATIEQVQELEEKLSELSKLYGDLKSDLNLKAKDLQKEIKEVAGSSKDIFSISQGKPSTGQLNLIDSSDKSDVNNELKSDSINLEPLSLRSLAERFQMGHKSLGNRKSLFRTEPEKFVEWSRKKDKDGIAWDPYQEDKLCHPIYE